MPSTPTPHRHLLSSGLVSACFSPTPPASSNSSGDDAIRDSLPCVCPCWCWQACCWQPQRPWRKSVSAAVGHGLGLLDQLLLARLSAFWRRGARCGLVGTVGESAAPLLHTSAEPIPPCSHCAERDRRGGGWLGAVPTATSVLRGVRGPRAPAPLSTTRTCRLLGRCARVPRPDGPRGSFALRRTTGPHVPSPHTPPHTGTAPFIGVIPSLSPVPLALLLRRLWAPTQSIQPHPTLQSWQYFFLAAQSPMPPTLAQITQGVSTMAMNTTGTKTTAWRT